MDWGLFDRGAGENIFLREEIVYPHKVCPDPLHTVCAPTFKLIQPPCFCFLSVQAYYYCAIVEDVILRFAWIIQIALTTTNEINSVGDIVATVLAPLEVFR